MHDPIMSALRDLARDARRGALAHPALAAALAATLALLLAHARFYAFLTDDAFISFRYARNLAHGHGLVFNPGFERVEGASNLLWVLILAALEVAHVAPERAATVLGFALTVVLWAMVAWFAVREHAREGARWTAVVAPLLLASTRSVAVWSTSGLETRLFEVLVIGGALRLVVDVERTLDRRPTSFTPAAVLFALAVLTRPDGLLFALAAFGAAAGTLMLRRRFDGRALVGAWPLPAIVAALFAFRLAYYGYPWPNTYYAKVGAPWWSSGLKYLAAFTLEYAAYLWLPLIALAVAHRRARGALFPPLLFAALVVPHALYVASIGGDHFEYRPLDLYLPLLFLLVGEGFAALARRRGAALSTAALAVLLVGLTDLAYQSRRRRPVRFAGDLFGRLGPDFLSASDDPVYRWPGLRAVHQRYRRLLDELASSYVAVRQEDHLRLHESQLVAAHAVRRMIDDGTLPRDTHLALGCAGVLPYTTDLRSLDVLGLTDAHVAHGPRRGGKRLMAHEKQATEDYAWSRGVDLWSVNWARPVLTLRQLLVHAAALPPATERTLVYYERPGEDIFLVGVLPPADRRQTFRLSHLPFVAGAELWRDAAKVERGVAEMRRAIQDDPGDARTRAELGLVLRRAGRAAGE
jgi:arabinofuranosyltransferase